MKVKKLKW